MKENKKLISRKEVLKQLGALSIGVPLLPGYFKGTSFFKHEALTGGKELAPLFPFQLSHESPDNITNFKHLLEVPAGKHGFIRAKDGRFVNNAGIVRLNGTNLTGSANVPSKPDAEMLANRMAALGINCVRLHYMDTDYGNFMQPKEQGIIAHDPNTQRNLDAQQLDKLDYLIAALKKRGIYVNINLHVGRLWDERGGFPHKDQRPHVDKGLDNFEPRMIELQKEYARKLLTHVNPYTALPYTNEPAVAVIEINNENALFNQYFNGKIDKLPDPYAAEFRRQWNLWLKKKYKNTSALTKAWQQESNDISTVLQSGQGIEEGNIATIPLNSKVPLPAKKDFYNFITDTEYAYWTGMYKFLKDELKVRSVISGTQLNVYSTPFIQAELDYLDIHTYWCHPNPINADWRIENKALVNSMSTIQMLACQRVKGKPYTISEYNHPFPNQYGAEGQPLIRAYGSLQGWDGVFEYTFHHRNNFNPSNNNYFFSISDRTDVIAHFPACSAIYLRGDVKEAVTTCIGALQYQPYFENLVNKNSVKGGIDLCGLDIQNTLVHKTAVELEGKKNIPASDSDSIAEKKVLTSDTGELVWNREDTAAGYFTVNTPNTKLFTGFPKEREILLGDITLAIGETRLGWATISLVSKHANGFGEKGAANILLTATGVTQNNDMKIVQYEGVKIQLADWGQAPVYAEGIPATLILPVNTGRVTCFALDASGNRKEQISITESAGNKTNITIKPEYKTVWYEIAIS